MKPGDISFGARFFFLAWTVVAGLFAAGGAMLPAAEPEPELPSFSVLGGVFTNSLRVALQAGKATIRFTTDGSEPGADSALFTAPLEVTNFTILRARAWHPDGRVSRPVTHAYILLDQQAAKFSSSLPLVVLNTGGSEVTHEEKTFAAARIIRNTGGRNTLLDKADFEGLAKLNVRGHSSLRYPKHSYTFKLVNEFGDAQNASLLGLPKESEWVLYGPYPDKTMMRDALAYDLSNQMGRWAPHWRYVEVFANESNGKLTMSHYAGVYMLVEKVVRGKARVDIAKLDPSVTREPDISGGYIFKKDHASKTERKRFGADGPPQATSPSNRLGYPTPPGGFPADPAGFLPAYDGKSSGRTSRNNVKTLPPPNRGKKRGRVDSAPIAITNYVALVAPGGKKVADDEVFYDDEGFRTKLQTVEFYYYEPEPDELTAVQRAWLKDYVNGLESVLYGPDFADPKKGYRAWLDADSFIDQHLLVETTKNVDGFRFSTFYYKDRGQRLNMGPAWDWNLSFGNASGKQGYMPEHWLWPQLDDQQYAWFRRLFEDPDFAQRYVDRWAELRTNVFATSNVLARIDELAAVLKEPQQRNFAKWSIMGEDISPNYFVGSSYKEEVDWMKEWITKRLAWIEAQFLAAPAIRPGQSIELTTSVAGGKIYYTVDGTDPRAPGGDVAKAAKAYAGPVSNPSGNRFVARVQSGNRWSPPTVLSLPK